MRSTLLLVSSIILFAFISFDCLAQPGNDLCSNATSISINLPGQCPGNAVSGTTAGSLNEGEVSGCEPNNGDVFYSFNTASFSDLTITLDPGTATDLVLTVLESCNGASVYCDFNPTGPQPLELTPQTTYFIRISTNTAFGSTGTFDLCVEGVYDCSIFEGNIGDPCDDGDPTTVNEVIIPGCSCVGVVATANDLCENAQELVVQPPTECFGNEVIGTTDNASPSTLSELCELSSPDVYYSFNAGSYSLVIVSIEAITATDLVVSFLNSCSELLPGDNCFIGTSQGLIVPVVPGEDYFIRVHTFFPTAVGTFSICVGGIYDCPDLGGNIGDACSDGDINTINDEIQEGCTCAGTALPVPPNDLCSNAEVVSLNLPGGCPGNAVSGTTVGSSSEGDSNSCEFDNPDVFYQFSSGDFSSVLVGLQAVTATDLVLNVSDNCQGIASSCNYNPDEPVSIEVQPNTVYYIRVSTNIFLGLPGSFNLCVQGVYDCPDLSVNVGDPCDDGNINTINDAYTGSCTCEGELLPAPPNDLCSNAISIPVNPPGECPANAVIGTTFGSSNEGGFTACEPTQPDVFYTFNSGASTEIELTLNPITTTDWVVSVLTACDGAQVICSFTPEEPLTVTVTPNTDYIVRVHTNLDFGDPGTFELCLSEVPVEISDVSFLIPDWDATCADRNVRVRLYQPGSTILVEEYFSSVGPSGSFQIMGIPNGTYDVFVKLDRYLQDGASSITFTGGDLSFGIPQPRLGDLNNDNTVNFFDGSIFNNFLSPQPYNPVADYNCDGTVNFFDVSALNNTFGQSGDNPPLTAP
jgi:hypothetical protein